MPFSRRFFLKSGTLTALATVLAHQAGSLVLGQSPNTSQNYPIPPSAQGDMLYYASYDTFQPYIGSIFTARGAKGEIVQLTLTSVTKYVPNSTTKISTAKSPITSSCSLSFNATGKLPDFSSIPDLHHPALGKLSMFLTYKAEGDSGYLYEAVINHLGPTVMLAPVDDLPPSKPGKFKPLQPRPIPTTKGSVEKTPATPRDTTPSRKPLRKLGPDQ